MTHSDGVYYFVNEKGEGMMVRQSEKITDGYALVLDKDLDGTIEECRSRSDCAAAQFEVNHARNKTELMSAQCMSPCYFKDYWGRVSYHVDHTNQWAEPPQSYQDVERAITVRFDVHVPSDAAAREVHRIIADADGKTVTANMARRLKIDSQFTRSVPWAIDSQSLVPGSMTSARGSASGDGARLRAGEPHHRGGGRVSRGGEIRDHGGVLREGGSDAAHRRGLDRRANDEDGGDSNG